MSKFNDLKESIKNPPQERLCLINANGYKLGMLAIIVISLILFQTVIWYISFIFLVQLVNNWVGYKREMNQYNSIVEARKNMGIYVNIEEDPSFIRRRFRLISKNIGGWFKYFIISIVGVSLGYCYDIINRGLLDRFLISLLIFVVFIIIYLYPMYWLAKLFNKEDGN